MEAAERTVEEDALSSRENATAENEAASGVEAVEDKLGLLSLSSLLAMDRVSFRSFFTLSSK